MWRIFSRRQMNYELMRRRGGCTVECVAMNYSGACKQVYQTVGKAGQAKRELKTGIEFFKSFQCMTCQKV